MTLATKIHYFSSWRYWILKYIFYDQYFAELNWRCENWKKYACKSTSEPIQRISFFKCCTKAVHKFSTKLEHFQSTFNMFNGNSCKNKTIQSFWVPIHFFCACLNYASFSFPLSHLPTTSNTYEKREKIKQLKFHGFWVCAFAFSNAKSILVCVL